MKKHMVVYIVLCLSGSSNVLAMELEQLVPSMKAAPSVYGIKLGEIASEPGQTHSCSVIPTSPGFVPIDSQTLIRQSPELQQQVERVAESQRCELEKKLVALGVEDSKFQAKEMAQGLMKLLLTSCSALVESELSTKQVYKQASPEEKQKMKKVCFEKMVGAMSQAGINSFMQYVASGELSDTASSGSTSSDEAETLG